MLLVLVAILVSLLVYYYVRRKEKHETFWKHIMAIPGPESIPLIGTFYKITSEDNLWHKNREQAQKFFPIYKIWCFDFAAVLLMSPEDIEKVLDNKMHISRSVLYDFFKDIVGDGHFIANGQQWYKRRKLITPAYNFNVLLKYVDVFNAETLYLIKGLKEQSQKPYINVVDMSRDFTMSCLGKTSFGLSMRGDKYKKYKEAVHDYAQMLIKKTTNPLLLIPFFSKWTSLHKRGKEAKDFIKNFSINVITEKEKIIDKDANYFDGKPLGLMDLLLKAKKDGADIDDKGIREEIDTFMFAGHDTTAKALSFLLFSLGNEPDIQETVYQEILSVMGDLEIPTYKQLKELKHLERCIKESLRLYPVSPIIGREAGEDIVTKDGYTIPKGCNIFISIYDLHRRPEYWENPEKFDPDRFLPENCFKRHPFAYIPFSAGSRNCIGLKFALLELKAVACGIVKNFKLQSKIKAEDIELRADIVMKTKDEILDVKFVPRIDDVFAV